MYLSTLSQALVTFISKFCLTFEKKMFNLRQVGYGSI